MSLEPTTSLQDIPLDGFKQLALYLGPDLIGGLGGTSKFFRNLTRHPELLKIVAENLGSSLNESVDLLLSIKLQISSLSSRIQEIKKTDLFLKKEFEKIRGLFKQNSKDPNRPLSIEQALFLEQCNLQATITKFKQGVPHDIKSLLNTSKLLSAKDLQFLRKYIKDRDQIIFAEEIANRANVSLPYQSNPQNWGNSVYIFSHAQLLSDWWSNSINAAKFDKITELDLSENMLTSIPPQIGQLSNLTKLKLDKNVLTSLPPEIGNLKALKELSASENRLLFLPSEIGELISLVDLKLCSNLLRNLPIQIGAMKALRRLQLDSNQLTCFPQEIIFLRLTYLSLMGNSLSQLPVDICKIITLETLYCDRNNFTSLPNEIGSLQALTILSFSKNKISRLPKSMQNLKNLFSLYLDDNDLIDADIIEKLRNEKLSVYLKGSKLTHSITPYVFHEFSADEKYISRDCYIF